MSVLDRIFLRAVTGSVVALVLGGCAATHVGNTWQCPLVQGSACASVAEADPAAPGRFSTPTPATAGAEAEPSGVRARRSRTATGSRAPAGRPVAGTRTHEPECRRVCRVQDWLGRTFGRAGEVPGDGPETQPENASGIDEPQPGAAWRDSARTPEVLGRIWIAPHVDASGVYHEASWVRVVIEPAGWRNAP